MRIDWKDPMIISIITGNITLIISIIFFAILKPRVIMKVKDNYKHGINWLKLILLSIVIGLVMAIVTFLYMVRNLSVSAEIIQKPFSHSY